MSSNDQAAREREEQHRCDQAERAKQQQLAGQKQMQDAEAARAAAAQQNRPAGW